MIKIDINNVIASAPAAQTAKNYVGSAKNGVANVRWQIDGRVRSRSNIEARLNNVHYALGQIEAKIGEIKNLTGFAANRYWQNEQYIKMCAMHLRSVNGLVGRSSVYLPLKMTRSYLRYLYNRIFGWRRYFGRIVSSLGGLAARWLSSYNKKRISVNTGAINLLKAGIGVLHGLTTWQNKLAAAVVNTYTGAKSFVDTRVNDVSRLIAKWQIEIKTAGTTLALGAVATVIGGAASGALLAIWLSSLFGKKAPEKKESPKPEPPAKPKEKEKEPPKGNGAPLDYEYKNSKFVTNGFNAKYLYNQFNPEWTPVFGDVGCSATSYAMALAQISGNDVNPTQFWGNDGCTWGGDWDGATYDENTILQSAYDRVTTDKMPCVVGVNPAHYVCVIGIREGADRNTLTRADFLIAETAPNESGNQIMTLNESSGLNNKNADGSFVSKVSINQIVIPRVK